MTRPDWAPYGVDLDRPNAARVYDYYLGGAHNFAVDREMAAQAMAAWPELPQIMRANRAFLRRAVRFLVRSGVRQFLDLGSGIPTVGNVHEVARAQDPSCRVVYVDIDPVAVAQSRAILDGDPLVRAVQADLRSPARVLDLAVTEGGLDLAQPVAVLLVAVLHFVADGDDPAGVIGGYREATAPGSAIAVCHATADGQGDKADEHRAFYARTPTPMTMRSRAEVGKLLEGYELVEPGLVYMALWRPEDDELPDRPEDYPGYAAVGFHPVGTRPAP
ncbi:SAM-dependent methyltransferase [Phytohabitans sp. ZYX-F-186]|uniref:SAM-dependent methyltransferase n=1 Tax=Phytohabitans maris TaxID=3071409 RepID=A0ABU0ZH91_9ACTN|nr:SAM-dependent methyltransferase [Phytohabitans sp. ZYX-F-186]MDQ7906423.1 SAM-dependent methyltransferase [Phytohabitans sp. ZYX-F-186]